MGCGPQELMHAIAGGSSLRCTSTTGMNETSSRSHAILQVVQSPTDYLLRLISFVPVLRPALFRFSFLAVPSLVYQ
jgi:hypothetical protein